MRKPGYWIAKQHIQKNGRFNSGPWEGVILFIARSPIKCASASEVKNAFFFRAQSSLEGNRGNQN